MGSHRNGPGGLVRHLVAVAAIATVFTAGCSSSGSTGKATAPTTTAATVDTLAPPTVVNAATTTVEARDNLYAPEHLQVKVGTKVTFSNEGRNQHDVVATDPQKFDFSIPQEKFDPGMKATFTFTKPGTYEYYCSLHATATAGSMRGVITVTK